MAEDQDLQALRKEVFEMRNLIIKTDNLLRTFHLELKDIGKKHDHTAARHKLSNLGAYGMLTVLGIGFALAYGAAIRKGAHQESDTLLQQAQATQAQADQALKAAQEHARAQEHASSEALAIWSLVTNNDVNKQDEGLVRASKLQRDKLTPFARAALEHTTREMRVVRSEKAFADGMNEQRANNPKAAREAFERFLAIADQMPKDWKPTERLQAAYQLGALCNQLGAHNEALPQLRKFIAEGESNSAKAYAYLLIGDSLEALRQPKEAQDAFRAGLDLRPSGVTASMLQKRVAAAGPT